VPRVTDPARILVVGSGGREHALAWRLARDAEVDEVVVAPGNDGIGRSFRRLAVAEDDADGLVAACRDQAIGLVVIGPEAPLAAGLADRLGAAGILVYGPSAAAARIESSKWFAKELMREAGVPSARAHLFEAFEPARDALRACAPPWVLKADGLAAGKGVLVTADRDQAETFLTGCFSGTRFGASGRRVLIEEHLEGEEASLMAVCDGERFALLPPARDYKRAADGDRGSNTGGMGAHAPFSRVNERHEREVGLRVVAPVLAAFAARGTPYRGTLYAGLMLTDQGPRVIEFNCRFGDPESQVVLPQVEGSLFALLASAAAGELAEDAIHRGDGASVTVALVDEGYPDRLRGDGVIEGLDALIRDESGVTLFCAGIADQNGRWTVRGGRAAYVTARAATLAEARALVYAAIAGLGGAGWRYRRDIAGAAAGAPLAHGPLRGAA
jgi:phosphoribosylamine---glycine ligase